MGARKEREERGDTRGRQGMDGGENDEGNDTDRYGMDLVEDARSKCHSNHSLVP